MNELIGGQSYYVVFTIEGQSVMVKTIFTGESTPLLDGTIVYFFTHYNDDTREYTFTEKQLKGFLGVNDKSKRNTDATVSLV